MISTVNNSNTKSYIMLIMASLIFASNHVIGRQFNEILPPFGTAFWRFAIGAMVTLPFAGLAFVKNWPLIRSNLRFFLFLSLLFVPLGNGLIYLSYQWTTATNGGVVTTVQPAFTVILSALIFGDLIKESIKRISDLSLREKLCLYPFVILIIFLGFYPLIVLNMFSPSLELLIESLE